MTQLCAYLNVDPASVSWDAATETVEGDVSSVIGNIFTAHFGELWSPRVQCQTCQGNGEIVTDWDRYLHGEDGDKGDEGTAECPDCGGDGSVGNATPSASGGLEAVRGAFIAGWWVNAATPGEDGAGDKAYFDGCAEVDWQDYRAALAAPAATRGEPAAWFCGGCGETDPSKRCFGCLHGLEPYPPPAPAVESAQVKEAARLALEWDERRGYIMPYRVRDKLRASLATDAEG